MFHGGNESDEFRGSSYYELYANRNPRLRDRKDIAANDTVFHRREAIPNFWATVYINLFPFLTRFRSILHLYRRCLSKGVTITDSLRILAFVWRYTNLRNLYANVLFASNMHKTSISALFFERRWGKDWERNDGNYASSRAFDVIFNAGTTAE